MKRVWMRLVLTALVAAMVLSAAALAEMQTTTQGEAVYVKITAEAAKARMDAEEPVIVLDVRTPSEYEAGHIPGAINLPNEEIGAEMPELLPDPDAEILVYCRSGRRSQDASEKLIGLGYTNVFDFGGINDWPYETE